MTLDLDKKLNTLPRTPGVYFHKNQAGEIIYVGKAAVLRNRVRQYFQSTRDKDIKTQALIAEIADTDWVETESEIDALFLESEMVKRYMPRYNILLRDDKSQTFVRIDMNNEWPYVSFTRNPADDGATYFGPYYNGFAVKKALRYLRKVFPYYTKEPKAGVRPSLDSHLGLEPGADMTSLEYKANLKKLIRYIEGGRKQLVVELEKSMKQAAKGQQFEEAARLRNDVRYLGELQRKIMFGNREFLDISKDKALSQLAEILLLKKPPSRIEGFDISHLSGTAVVASQVVFVNGVSSRGDYRKYKAKTQKNDDYAQIYEVIYRRFGQKNIQSWGVPSLLLIDGGKGQLEAAARALRDRQVDVPLVSIAKREEELIVHKIHSGVDVSGLEALAKNPTDDIAVDRSGDCLTVNLHPGQRNASGHSRNLRAGAAISKYSDTVKLIQRIRDESHRFAVSYHTVLRRSQQTTSLLDGIPGIGEATRRKLLKTFGSVKAIGEASDESLREAVGVSKAATLRKYLPTK